MLLCESHQKLVWHPRYPPKTDTYSSDLLWVPAGQNIQWGQIALEILGHRGETARVDSGNWKKGCLLATESEWQSLILILISSSKKLIIEWHQIAIYCKKIFSAWYWNTNNMFNLNFEPGNYNISSIFSFRCTILEKISIRYKKKQEVLPKTIIFCAQISARTKCLSKE